MKNGVLFRDRMEAGALLAEKLKKYRNDEGILLAVPRGGVPVAYAVAQELGFPVDIILTKKISHPLYKEYAIGAASLTDYFVIPHENISEEYIKEELGRIRSKLKEMHKRFNGTEVAENLEGKTVIVIDDGIATGNTILGTVNVLRKSRPARIIIGVPVASRASVDLLLKEVDDVVAVLIPDKFYGVGAFYEDFEQVSDEEVLFYLDRLKDLKKSA